MSFVPRVDDGFWPILVHDARAMPGSPDPRDLAAVMFAESEVDPNARNASVPNCRPFDPPCAIGLNQLYASNWDAFGVKNPDTYLALSASDQWQSVVRRFFAGQLATHPGGARSAADLYWLNYSPATFQPDAPEDAIVQPSAPNDPGLADPDGKVRLSGLRRVLLARQNENPGRWALVLQAIENAERGGLGASPASMATRTGIGVGLPVLALFGLGVVLLRKR